MRVVRVAQLGPRALTLSAARVFMRVMHIGFGIPLISAGHDPHFPALQFPRTASSHRFLFHVCVILKVRRRDNKDRP
jgi:hypothetical protein